MIVASLQSLGYLPVATATLFPARGIECDLFLQHGAADVELYRRGSYPLTEEDLQRLNTSGIDHLYIRAADADAYRSYLCSEVLNQTSVPAPIRIAALREVTRVAFQDVLESNDPNKAVDWAQDMGRGLATMIADQAVKLSEVYDLLEHDYYTFTHVCNVCTYCVILARDLGLGDKHVLAQVATGALLHDIGKRHVPKDVLNKKDKPTEAEWEIIRSHPAIGYQELCHRADLSWAQLMMVYQHHERLDGSGYPTGAAGGDIHVWARLCAVVDVFDALTCSRPYRDAVPAMEVCRYLEGQSPRWFDQDMVACWASQVRRLA
ncbi:MAG TPA: HD domain-containing phosphohydrolase [Pirellulales bacterium]|jgi:HD-GYP domain-containing protein (c-di-GMP phosphodiesterase class II)|nr:HD domain-containing phosphohydrolase [Pirellulales bacterium]